MSPPVASALGRGCQTRAVGADGLRWLEPVWPVAARVRVVSTLRSGGSSRGCHAGLNLAEHVDDAPDAVAENRRRLRVAARLPAEPGWLEQVHGTAVVDVATLRGNVAQGDAGFADEPGFVAAVLTADCLPVVIADRSATRVAVAHAGWRGLAAGVLEACIARLGVPSGELHAWLGPAISQPSFEVGAEVRDAFVTRAREYEAAFVPNERGRFQADLFELARLRLRDCGVAAVHGGGWCTAAQRGLYYSFRRDGTTGRMATLAWLDAVAC
jgi:YfiH family protein